jgi:hypothetical protein
MGSTKKKKNASTTKKHQESHDASAVTRQETEIIKKQDDFKPAHEVLNPSFYHFVLDEYASSEFGNVPIEVCQNMIKILSTFKCPSSGTAEKLVSSTKKVLKSSLVTLLKLVHVMVRLVKAMNANLSAANIQNDLREFNQQLRHCSLDELSAKELVMQAEDDSKHAREMLCYHAARIMHHTITSDVQNKSIVLLTGSTTHAISIFLDFSTSLTHPHITVCNSGDGLEFHKQRDGIPVDTGDGASALYIPELRQIMVEMQGTTEKACVLLMWYFRNMLAMYAPGGFSQNITVEALYKKVLLTKKITFELPKKAMADSDDANANDDIKEDNKDNETWIKARLDGLHPEEFFFPPQKSGSCTFYSLYYLVRFLITRAEERAKMTPGAVFLRLHEHLSSTYLDMLSDAIRKNLLESEGNQALHKDNSWNTLLHVIQTKFSALAGTRLKQYVQFYGLNLEDEERMRKRWLEVVSETFKHPAVSSHALPSPGVNIVSPQIRMKTKGTAFKPLPFSFEDFEYTPHGDSDGMIHALKSAPSVLHLFEMLNGSTAEDKHGVLPKIYETLYKTGIDYTIKWLQEKWLWMCYKREDAFFVIPEDMNSTYGNESILQLLKLITALDDATHGVYLLAYCESVDALLRLGIFLKICEVNKFKQSPFHPSKDVKNLEHFQMLHPEECARFRYLCTSRKMNYHDDDVSTADKHNLLSHLSCYHSYFVSNKTFYEVWTTAFSKSLYHASDLAQPPRKFYYRTVAKINAESIFPSEKKEWNRVPHSLRVFIHQFSISNNSLQTQESMFAYFYLFAGNPRSTTLKFSETKGKECMLLEQKRYSHPHTASVGQTYPVEMDMLSLIRANDLAGVKAAIRNASHVHENDVGLLWPLFTPSSEIAPRDAESNTAESVSLSRTQLMKQGLQLILMDMTRMLTSQLSLHTDGELIYYLFSLLLRYDVPVKDEHVRTHFLKFLYSLLDCSEETEFVSTCTKEFYKDGADEDRGALSKQNILMCFASFMYLKHLRRESAGVSHVLHLMILNSRLVGARDIFELWSIKYFANNIRTLTADNLQDSADDLIVHAKETASACSRSEFGLSYMSYANVRMRTTGSDVHAHVYLYDLGSLLHAIGLDDVSSLLNKYVFTSLDAPQASQKAKHQVKSKSFDSKKTYQTLTGHLKQHRHGPSTTLMVNVHSRSYTTNGAHKLNIDVYYDTIIQGARQRLHLFIAPRVYLESTFPIFEYMKRMDNQMFRIWATETQDIYVLEIYTCDVACVCIQNTGATASDPPSFTVYYVGKDGDSDMAHMTHAFCDNTAPSIYRRWASNTKNRIHLIQNCTTKEYKLFFTTSSSLMWKTPFMEKEIQYYNTKYSADTRLSYVLPISRNGLYVNAHGDADKLTEYLILLAWSSKFHELHALFDQYKNISIYSKEEEDDSFRLDDGDFGSPYRFFYMRKEEGDDYALRVALYPMAYQTIDAARHMKHVSMSYTYQHEFKLLRSMEKQLHMHDQEVASLKTHKTSKITSSGKNDGQCDVLDLDIEAFQKHILSFKKINTDALPTLSALQGWRTTLEITKRKHTLSLSETWERLHHSRDYMLYDFVSIAAKDLYTMMECDLLLDMATHLVSFLQKYEELSTRVHDGQAVEQAYDDIIKTVKSDNFGVYRGRRPFVVILFESCFETFIFNQQMDLFQQMKHRVLEKGQPWFASFQLLMGKGKSSVLTPLLIFSLLHMHNTDSQNLLDRAKNVALVLPGHLIQQAVALLAGKYSNVLPFTTIRQVGIDRSWSYVQKFEETFAFSTSFDKDTGSVFVMSDLSLKSLKLNLIEQFGNKKSAFSSSAKAQRNIETDIQRQHPVLVEAGKFMQYYMHYLFDEIDSVLSPLSSELNYPNAESRKVHEHLCIEHFALDFISYLNASHRTGVFETIDEARDTVIQYTQEFASWLAKTIEQTDRTDRGVWRADEYTDALLYYVHGASAGKTSTPTSTNAHKVYCIHRVVHTLAYTLTLIYNKDYGFGNEKDREASTNQLKETKNNLVAIPYQAVGQPINGSEFSDPVLSVLMTTLTYMYTRSLRHLDVSVLRAYMTSELYNCGGSIKAFLNTDWRHVIAGYTHFPQQDLSTLDWNLFAAHIMGDRMRFIAYLQILLPRRIFPTYMRVHVEQLNLSFMDVACSSFTQNRVGFSGTINIPIPAYFPEDVYAETQVSEKPLLKQGSSTSTKISVSRTAKNVQNCTSGKVRNPSTNRCVLAAGKIGKQLQESHPQLFTSSSEAYTDKVDHMIDVDLSAQFATSQISTAWVIPDVVSNGGIKTALLGLRNPAHTYAVDNAADVLKVMFSVTNILIYDVLIDAGAFFREYTARQTALIISDMLLQAGFPRRVTYIDEDDKIRHLAAPLFKNGEHRNSAASDRMPFIFYDHKHIVGIDIKQPRSLRGMVTVNYFNTFTEVAQAAFRMRNLNYGHVLDYAHFRNLMRLLHHVELETYGSISTKSSTQGSNGSDAEEKAAAVAIYRFLSLMETKKIASMKSQLCQQTLKIVRRYRKEPHLQNMEDFIDPCFDERAQDLISLGDLLGKKHSSTASLYNDWLHSRLCTLTAVLSSSLVGHSTAHKIGQLCGQLRGATLINLQSTSQSRNDKKLTDMATNTNTNQVSTYGYSSLPVVFNDGSLVPPLDQYLLFATVDPQSFIPISNKSARSVTAWKSVVNLLQASGLCPTSYFMEQWIWNLEKYQHTYWTKKANLFCLQDPQATRNTLLVSQEEAVGICMALSVTPPAKKKIVYLWDKYGCNCVPAGLVSSSSSAKGKINHGSSMVNVSNPAESVHSAMNCFVLYLMGKQLNIEERITVLLLLTVQPLLQRVLKSSSQLLKVETGEKEDEKNIFTILTGIQIVQSLKKPIVPLMLSLSQTPDGTIQRILALPNVENIVFTAVFHPMVAVFLQTHGYNFITLATRASRDVDVEKVLTSEADMAQKAQNLVKHTQKHNSKKKKKTSLG